MSSLLNFRLSSFKRITFPFALLILREQNPIIMEYTVHCALLSCRLLTQHMYFAGTRHISLEKTNNDYVVKRLIFMLHFYINNGSHFYVKGVTRSDDPAGNYHQTAQIPSAL